MSLRRNHPVRLGLVIGQLSAGGAEGQLCILCRGIDRDKFTPLVYCLSARTQPYGRDIEALGVPLRVITGSRLAKVWRLRQWLQRDAIDVVHAWLFIANAYAWVANLGLQRPLITSARNCKRQGPALDLLNRWAFARSTTIVANSGQVATYIAREYKAAGDRTAVVYNAIDTQRFHPTPGRQDAGLCVAMIGRLVPQKNPQLFISAAAKLRQHIANVRFMLIGDGPLREPLQAEIERAGLRDCCVLMGERHDVPELLRQADLFWLTSDWEGLPNAVLEAMATGLPVVVTDVGGAGEIVRPGQDGYLIHVGDGDALVTRSLALLTDAEQRGRFSRAARDRAEEFAPKRMVAAMEQLYTRALQGRQG